MLTTPPGPYIITSIYKRQSSLVWMLLEQDLHADFWRFNLSSERILLNMDMLNAILLKETFQWNLKE